MDFAALVNTAPSSFEDCRRSNSVLQCGQTLGIQVIECGLAVVHSGAAVNELLNGNVAVAGLPLEVTVLIRRIAHVERVSPDELSDLVVGDIVATVGLVDSYLTISSKVVEVLVGVYAGTLRGRPRGCVDADSTFAGVVLLSPGDEQGDGVLGLIGTAKVHGDTLGR